MTDQKDAPPLLAIHEAMLVKNGKRLLDNLSLTIHQGQHTAIFGPNGSGKSSLIKLITRQHYPKAREGGKPPVALFGQDRWDVFTLRSLLGIVSADLHQALVGAGALPGLEVVLSGFFASEGLGRHHRITSGMRERAQMALAQTEAAHLGEKPMEEMSSGEARRVLIARALVSDPRALLLDEPTAGLDIVARRRFLETLRHIAQQGRTVILVTHHVEEILPEIQRVVLLKGGRVFREGSKEDVLISQNLSDLFEDQIAVHRYGDYYAADAALEILASAHHA